MRRIALRAAVPIAVSLAAIVGIVPIAIAGGVPDESPGVSRLARVSNPAIVRRTGLLLGQARVMRFARPIVTLVVGDSAVVDTELLDQHTVVLTAIGLGQTNLLALGPGHAAHANVMINVRRAGHETLVYSGAAPAGWICNPRCHGPAAAP